VPQKLEISFSTEQLLAFQEMLFYVEFVKYFQMTPITSRATWLPISDAQV
jgi:hypothetical protein